MVSAPSDPALAIQILHAITAHSPPLPHPSSSFLASLIPARRPPPPLPSLVATARTRLLASDLTAPAGTVYDLAWAARASFPAELRDTNANATSGGATSPLERKEVRLAHDVTVQVLDIEDVARSRWEAVEELEAIERGEGKRGREVVRLSTSTEEDGQAEDGGDVPERRGGSAATAPGAAGAGTAAQQQQQARQRKSATHKLALQDPSGTMLFALELVRNPAWIGIGTTHIGEKIVLRVGTVVARGMVLLVPELTVFLGGRIEKWDTAWNAGRLERLKSQVGKKESTGAASAGRW